MSSIANTMSASQSINQLTLIQEKNNLLLNKVLDSQANTILGLIESAVTGPQKLAASGTVGTRVHVTA